MDCQVLLYRSGKERKTLRALALPDGGPPPVFMEIVALAESYLQSQVQMVAMSEF